ncbi:hypothetical protein Tco_1341221, partial [Tanacetum coccineum]
MVVRLWCYGGDAVIMLEAMRVVTRWWRRWCGDCCGAPAVVAEGGGGVASAAVRWQQRDGDDEVMVEMM